MPRSKNRRKTKRGQSKKNRNLRHEVLVREKPRGAYSNNQRRRPQEDPGWVKAFFQDTRGRLQPGLPPIFPTPEDQSSMTTT